MCLHDATSADEALLFSLCRNFLLGQHEQAAQRSPSLLVLFDEWKKVFYTSESQGFPFNYFQQNEYKVGCLNSKRTPSWTTQWGGIIFISGRWNQPWGTSGLISLDPERRIWMFVFIHMHNFSRRSQWQKKKVAKSTIFTPMTEAGVWKWFLCFVILQSAICWPRCNWEIWCNADIWLHTPVTKKPCELPDYRKWFLHPGGWQSG